MPGQWSVRLLRDTPSDSPLSYRRTSERSSQNSTPPHMQKASKSHLFLIDGFLSSFSNILNNLGGPIIKMAKFLLAVVLGLLSLQSVVSQGYRNENFILAASSPVSCQSIINQSRFGGTCCALNSTIGDGCTLTVINGECRVSTPFNACEMQSKWNSILYTKCVHNSNNLCHSPSFLHRLPVESGR